VTRLIRGYLGLLEIGRAHATYSERTCQQIAQVFQNLTPAEGLKLTEAENLVSGELEALAKRSGIPIKNCRAILDSFLIWRSKNRRFLRNPAKR
jgi:hypothetical protein